MTLIFFNIDKAVLTRIIVSTLLTIFAYATDIPLLFLLPYIIISYDILIKAAKGLANMQSFDENFLMAVAAIGAIIPGEYAVILFIRLVSFLRRLVIQHE